MYSQLIEWLLFVQGLTWLFAFLAIDGSTGFTLAMQYCFCIFNSLQGFLIFVFLNIREKYVRDGWVKIFKRMLCCQGSDTRSDVRRERPAPRKAASILTWGKRNGGGVNASKTNKKEDLIDSGMTTSHSGSSDDILRSRSESLSSAGSSKPDGIVESQLRYNKEIDLHNSVLM